MEIAILCKLGMKYVKRLSLNAFHVQNPGFIKRLDQYWR